MADQKRLAVGFVGMGIMGSAMARNCIKAGFPLTVYNRTRAKTVPLKEAGAAVADSPAQVAKASDVVLVCVTSSDDVLSVVLDPRVGVVAGVAAGATVVDHSTVAPWVAKRCAEALAAKNAGFLDAPVSGGDVGARGGTLSIMVGGEEAHFRRAMPVLQAMGKTVTLCGQSGAGYVVKLCNQVCGALHLIAAAEALRLATACGVDHQAMLKAVSSGAAASWMLSNLAPKMAAGDYAPGFFVDYQLKDLRLASQVAHDLSLPLPGTALAEVLFRAASAQGHGRDGTQSIYEVIGGLGHK
jgi:3-hydroxyisobutyrate dehydrogenase